LASGPFARIIVGYVPTDQGEDARALGVALAAACGAEPLLVSVVDTVWVERVGEPTGRVVVDRGERERAAVALAQAAELAQTCGNGRVDQLLQASSSPARGLHDTAVSEHADLIVVGSSHRGPIGRVLLGSVGERLLSGAPCAVAVAPRGHATRDSRHPKLIVVAFDGSPEAWFALRTAYRLAVCVGATLRALTVIVPRGTGVAVGEVMPFSGLDAVLSLADVEPLETMHLSEALERQERAARATLEAAVKTLGRGTSIQEQVVVGPDPASVIVDAARGQADLLVLGSRAYGPVRRTLLGSVSTTAVRHAPCPVLVTPRSAKKPSK
jgi:nucleotide-binding universal stress UspA family protein